MFITFEGVEGAGKSSQIRKLAEFLRNKGVPTSVSREPGGSPGAELIRELLLQGGTDRWDNITEVLLFFASRRDHVEKTIKPAIARGEWAISDRFSDSTYAYQLHGYKSENISKQDLDMLCTFVLGDFKPDITFVFDLPVEVGFARKRKQGDVFDRFESQALEFHNNMRQGYLEIAATDSKRYKLIDASKTVEEVHQDLIAHLSPWLD